MVEIKTIIMNCHQIAFTDSMCSMTLIPAGIKKNAIFESKKSDFSLMCSTLINPEKRRASKRIKEIIAAGKEKGNIAAIASPAKHIAKTIAI